MVTARYRSDLAPVLRNVSFSIAGGEKVSALGLTEGELPRASVVEPWLEYLVVRMVGLPGWRHRPYGCWQDISVADSIPYHRNREWQDHH